MEKLKQIEGVISITLNNLEYQIKISNERVASKVFEIVSKGKNITKFSIEQPSLNEIFIETVGETYDK